MHKYYKTFRSISVSVGFYVIVITITRGCRWLRIHIPFMDIQHVMRLHIYTYMHNCIFYKYMHTIRHKCDEHTPHIRNCSHIHTHTNMPILIIAIFAVVDCLFCRLVLQTSRSIHKRLSIKCYMIITCSWMDESQTVRYRPSLLNTRHMNSLAGNIENLSS